MAFVVVTVVGVVVVGDEQLREIMEIMQQILKQAINFHKSGIAIPFSFSFCPIALSIHIHWALQNELNFIAISTGVASFLISIISMWNELRKILYLFYAQLKQRPMIFSRVSF